MSENHEPRIRLTDNVGIYGITDEAVGGEVETNVEVDCLKRVVEIMDALGWQSVDICLDERADEDYPLPVFRPPSDALFSENAGGLVIAPKTEQGRSKNQQ